MLLIDEATRSLDVERERVVIAAIRQLAVTRVIVAHRPETIASASRVVALHEGRVAQDLRPVPSQAPMHWSAHGAAFRASARPGSRLSLRSSSSDRC